MSKASDGGGPLWFDEEPLTVSKESAGGSPQPQVPPQDLHAEQCVLGSMLLEAGAAERAFAILRDEDFYRQAHTTIYRAMQSLHRRGEPIDLITVASELRKQPLRDYVTEKEASLLGSALDKCGGPEYLTAIIGEVPTTAHVVKYAETVRELSIRRAVISLGMDSAGDAYYHKFLGRGERPIPTRELIDSVVARGMELEDRLNQQSRVVHFEDLKGSEDRIRASLIDRAQWHRTRPHFGFDPLDRRIMGLPMPGATWLQGLHKMGKTILGNMALLETAYEHRMHTVLFGTEMDLETQTFDRLVKMLIGVGVEDLAASDGYGEPDAQKLEDYLGMVEVVRQTANVTHVSASGMTAEEVVSRLRSIHRQRPVVLWILDHLQQLRDCEGANFGATSAAAQMFKRESMRLRNSFLGLTQVTITDGLTFSKGGRGPDESGDLIVKVDRKGRTLEEKQDSPVGMISIQGSRVSKGGRWEVVLRDNMRFGLLEPEGPVARRDKRYE